MSELRRDPTRGHWVLVRVVDARPAASDRCPFCPGNEALTPPEIAAYRAPGSPPNTPGWSVRVVPEIDPYFRIERQLLREGVGLYDKITPRGATELIVESPTHEDTPATMREGQWQQVLWMYRDRILDLKRDASIRDLLVTRRYRKPGARISHPYSRLTATPIIFDDVRLKLEACRDYYRYKRRCLYCDLIRQDLGTRERVVRATERFVVLVPYAGRSPYEIWILPRQHRDAYEEGITPEGAAELAALLAGCFRVLARVGEDPELEMTIYSSPNRRARLLPGEWATLSEDYHWHLEIQPGPDQARVVGGISVVELAAEEAAGRLRDVWESVSTG
jgi:UDPglucose--hexose-1-phosphate uridylyltransferase